MRVGVELLVIADIGFVGFPNAGKSSLLNLLTNARSKVAGYPFTTKIPQLGVMRYDDQDIVLADIPGILEGASEGLGMGFKFLRHISRTKGLAYLVDLSDDNYLEAFDILKEELRKYSEELASKPYVVIGTKIDELDCDKRLEELKEKYPDEEIYPLSIYIDELLIPVKQAFRKLVGDGAIKKVDDAGGFTSRMDSDAFYRDEE